MRDGSWLKETKAEREKKALEAQVSSEEARVSALVKGMTLTEVDSYAAALADPRDGGIPEDRFIYFMRKALKQRLGR